MTYLIARPTNNTIAIDSARNGLMGQIPAIPDTSNAKAKPSKYRRTMRLNL